MIRHDARLLPLDDESVDLIVTSPPYFALRSYRDKGKHYDSQIGSEDTPEAFLEALDGCMVEWRRVLKPSGSVWINLGDKYAGSSGQSTHGTGSSALHLGPHPATTKTVASTGGQGWSGDTHIRTKSLMGLPWRFAIRQIDAGWILRAEVVWSKPNGLPESVTDRVRRSHEQWFHFVKEPRYFSAVDEIREPGQTAPNPYRKLSTRRSDLLDEPRDQTRPTLSFQMDAPHPLGRLPGSVWTIPTEPLIIPDAVREAQSLPDHFAAFPQEWPRRIILGWSPSGVCVECGEGRRPVVSKEAQGPPRGQTATDRYQRVRSAVSGGQPTGTDVDVRLVGHACACPEPTATTTPAVVLDPFGGTGTVAGVARTLGRYGITNDLSADYNRLAIWRIWESGHFTKTEQRTWSDRQTRLI